MYPYVALRGPTYRENSHANHTWRQHSHKTACFVDSEAPSVWVRFPSPAPLIRQRQATQGYKNEVKTLIRWESLGNRRRGGGGFMASTFPALPRDSHVQSRAAVHENESCDSHARLVETAIACGWTQSCLRRRTALRVHSSATVEPILGPRTPTSLAQNFANSKGRPVDYFSCAPVSSATAPSVVCAAFRPRRKSLSEYVE